MPQIGEIGNDVGRTMTGALVGGTISELTGGKFANGAVTGAVQAAMAGRARSRSELSAPGSNEAGEFETTEPTGLRELKQKYPELQIRMNDDWSDSFGNMFRREQGFVGLENPSGTEMRYVDLESNWSWNPTSLGYKEIGFSGMAGKLAAAGIGNNWQVRVVFHTHPFDACYSICGPNSSHFGPSFGDQQVAGKLFGAFNVVRQMQGLTYQNNPRYQDLYYGHTATKR